MNRASQSRDNGELILRLRGISKQFGAVTALEDIQLDVHAGEVVALVGDNGAGKSTLFKAIMGFVPVAGGEIELLGMSVREALKRNLVAYVPQSEEVDWSFPVLVEDVVMMGRYGHMGFLRRPSKADHAAVAAALTPALGLVGAGRVRATVDRVVSLDDTPGAVAHLRSGGAVGKVVIEAAGP